MVDGMHLVFLGDHRLAADIRGADAVRELLRDQLLFRLPDFRCVVDETLVEGGPWSTRYHTEQNGRLVDRGVYFGRVEEVIRPDTKALSVALERAEKAQTE
ncbi:hypothetical protein [Mycobacterium sp. 050134]|uniref:hypothetical protein n=1 Tax=Mycobacterium sp. 050134 TaxID=3096111 RepID=UPI002EDAE69A